MHTIKNIGDTNTQIDMLSFYQLAAHSIINEKLKENMLELVNRNHSNLSKINNVHMVQALILLGTFYGYLRCVFNRKHFIKYTISALMAARKTNYIPFIFNSDLRGSITFELVSKLVQGVFPYKAVSNALSNHELGKIILLPKNLLNNNFKNNRNNSRNNNARNRNNNFGRNPNVKCRNCNYWLPRSEISHHRC